MDIKERKEKQAASYSELKERAITSLQTTIQYILMLHQLRFVAGSVRNSSYTKKGPGRKHKQGKQRYV